MAICCGESTDVHASFSLGSVTRICLLTRTSALTVLTVSCPCLLVLPPTCRPLRLLYSKLPTPRITELVWSRLASRAKPSPSPHHSRRREDHERNIRHCHTRAQDYAYAGRRQIARAVVHVTRYTATRYPKDRRSLASLPPLNCELVVTP